MLRTAGLTAGGFVFWNAFFASFGQSAIRCHPDITGAN
jgi:hypothetical protein